MHLREGDRIPEFTAKDLDGNSLSPADFRGRKNILFFFSRYIACSWCQMFIIDLIRHRRDVEKLSCEVIVVSESPPEVMRNYKPDGMYFRLISDPSKELYGLFGVKKRGSILAKSVITMSLAFLPYLRRYQYIRGGLKGDSFQVPAVFIAGKDGRVVYAFVSDDIAAHPFVSHILQRVPGD